MFFARRRKQNTALCLAAALLLAVLAGCAPTPEAPASAETPAPTAAPTPTASPTPVPTATPAPTEVELYGRVFPADAEEIDLSGVEIPDGGAVIVDALPLLPRLQTVDMFDCGLSDEEMDALNLEHAPVRFLWYVHVGANVFRSDTKTFIASLESQGPLNNRTIGAMRYLRDMEVLDLGHQSFSDLSWVSNMTHLQYLILAEDPVTDLSPLRGLDELIYLEMFKTPVTDLSPLLDCKNLLDLNICYIPLDAGDSAREVLPQLQSLERLFYFGNPLSVQERNELIAAFPADREIVLYDGLESTGLDWRYHERYYEMRDRLGAYYMPGGTNPDDEEEEEEAAEAEIEENPDVI